MRALWQILVALSFLGHWVESTRAVTLSVANVRGFPGQVSPVPISMGQASNATAIQFDVAYSPERARIIEQTQSAIVSNHVLRWREIAPGVRRYLLYSPNGSTIPPSIPKARPLITMNVGVADAERSSSGPIGLRNSVIAQTDGLPLRPVTNVAGQVFVSTLFVGASGSAEMFFDVTADNTYVLKATEDFNVWTRIATNVATSAFLDFVDEDAPLFPHRFYAIVPFEAMQLNGWTAEWTADGFLGLHFAGINGLTYELQASRDLVNWTRLQTRTSGPSGVDFVDLDSAAYTHRFYRVREQ